MKVVVSTPTGNIGRVLTHHLLERGAEVVLTARRPDKVQDFVERGATALTGSLDDLDFVREATRGTDVLFWLTPPRLDVPDFRAHQKAFGRVAATVVEANRIPRVLHLSSLGAQHGSGVGPIGGLHDNEGLLNEVAENVTHLRPGAFMENVLGSLETIKTARSLFLPIRGDVPISWIATRDIGELAARRILDESWSGRTVVEQFGPEDLSYDQIAAILSEVLQEKISHVQVSADQAREAMTDLGFSDDVVSSFLELYAAFEKGDRIVGTQARSAENTGQTTFAEFAREVVAPLAKVG